jgi:hypothetical protein
LRALVEKRAKQRGASEAETSKATEQGVLLASGLIAGEGVMGIGTAVTALIMGRRPEGFSFGLTGVTGSVVSLVAFAVLGWILFRTASSRGHREAV